MDREERSKRLSNFYHSMDRNSVFIKVIRSRTSYYIGVVSIEENEIPVHSAALIAWEQTNCDHCVIQKSKADGLVRRSLTFDNDVSCAEILGKLRNSLEADGLSVDVEDLTQIIAGKQNGP